MLFLSSHVYLLIHQYFDIFPLTLCFLLYLIILASNQVTFPKNFLMLSYHVHLHSHKPSFLLNVLCHILFSNFLLYLHAKSYHFLKFLLHLIYYLFLKYQLMGHLTTFLTFFLPLMSKFYLIPIIMFLFLTCHAFFQ